jgi:hypothetical protein
MSDQTNPGYLRCYASGTGALSFTWLDENCIKATGRKVTPEDVAEYMKSEDGQRLAADKWEHKVVHGQHLLVKKVERVSENVVRIAQKDGTWEEFKYEIDQNNIFWTRDKLIVDNNIKIEWFFNDLNDWHRLVNLSMRFEIIFFLNNEAALKETA